MTDWRETLALKRRVNASNVFLLETDDPKRLEELLTGNPPLVVRLTTKPQGSEPLLVRFDLQRGRTTCNNCNVNSLPEALRLGEEKPVTVLVHWVAEKRHADAISDMLLAAAHNPAFYKPTGTEPGDKASTSIVVLAFSLELFGMGLRRFTVEIPIPPSTSEERGRLIRDLSINISKIKGRKLTVSSDAVKASAGLNLHEVETAVLESAITRGMVDAETFRRYKIEVLRRQGLEYVEPTRGFESVAGYEYLKSFLLGEVAMFYRNPSLAEDYGLTPPRGLLFFGPPGTGKTWVSRALAREMGIPMVKLSAADILRGIVGESEARARRIARIVESMAPVLVFVDEADQLFRSRAATLSTDSGVSQRVQNILLDWLGDEERKSFIVLATNFPEQLDWAAVRAGRIDCAVPVLLPDAKAREEILRYHIEVAKPPRVPVNVNYREVAGVTRGWTPAELAQLAKAAKVEAAREKARELLTDHVFVAMDKGFRVNVEERLASVRRMVDGLRTNAIVRQDIVEEALKALNT